MITLYNYLYEFAWTVIIHRSDGQEINYPYKCIPGKELNLIVYQGRNYPYKCISGKELHLIVYQGRNYPYECISGK